MEDAIYDDLKTSFENARAALKRELARVRTGRANINVFDSVKVPYYGQPTPLNQVANLQTPDPRQITIKPWEKSMLKEIERAIQTANLGFNPSNDGTIIRIEVAAPTEEKRKQLAKEVGDHGENAKVSIRNARRDANSLLDQLEKDKDISEDQLHRGKKKIQEMTDEAVGKIDAIVKKKTEEIMEV